jgi:hypothetical protein
MDRLLVFCVAWLIGAPVYLPDLLARLGVYKVWYFAPFIPPFSWKRSIHAWPASAGFICLPFLLFSSLSDEAVMLAFASLTFTGVLFAAVLMIWNPRWAKPLWQRRLEDRYSREEINEVLIPAWRGMNHREWGRLIETEEGLEQLVEMARNLPHCP